MTRALGFVVVTAVACGGARPPPPAPEHRPAPVVASASASASGAPAGPTPMARLDAMASKDAPGTRELLRRDVASAGSAAVELGAAEKDTCLRVFVLADFPAKVTLKSKGRELASGEVGDATALRLAPRGPVCVRHGEAPVLQIEGTGSAHVIVRASP
ncbi:MAG TPA: hypothetical protein VLM85_31235 [Polyangiaceae bacterium]|nr:hypothetical protein [Polyangiaceae bacterium]